ncbi:RNA methyltransferase TrmA [Furfurilactobacillus rossiae]|uniref:23S rRNA (uracil(1939)-C(5))-methyltransferase RlmD n=1 Tax=Furfurilactobacillus rossiae TaxID=231049 RepID=UPI0015BC61B5|nr:23S rRNA (uracil(1939)-C(5))-methyltransferase RlmD [Furfurilactobacillus rossiae]MCF6166074.1 23S rRNA (uracil(1939)-C(5))-methyltransferase RlmD [Furfurilactobacillus rossiae]QLE63266.1 RNA methyltransferase TrmA [Furfurilactobacillus rossiae]
MEPQSRNNRNRRSERGSSHFDHNNHQTHSQHRDDHRSFEHSRNNDRNGYHRQHSSQPEQADVQVEVGQRFPLTIKRLGINGEGIGYYRHKITFVPGALPDEVVVAEVTHVAAHFLNAKVHQIRKESDHRVTPPDTQSAEVGGFELSHLDYPSQLAFKRDVIRQALEKFQPRGWENYDLRPTIGMEDPYHYRNKAQFQVRQDADGNVIAGLYKEGTHDLVDLPEASTQNEATMTVIRALVKMLQELQVPIYNEEANSGIIKTLVVRSSEASGEVQVTFVTNSQKLPHKRKLLALIEERLPQVVSVMQNVNQSKTSLVWGDKTTKLMGQDYITETLLGKQFQLSPRAFLQLNPKQTTRLYEETIKALDLTHADHLVDAYSGVGTIGLSLADRAGEVRGMDTIEESVDDANRNADLNGITNAEYSVGTAEDLLPQWVSQGWRPDALVVDPPRAGLADTMIDTIMQVQPEKFVYVSCNPSTLAQNLVELGRVYRVEYIQSIDMFPQTARVEAVVKLVLR